MGFAKKTRNAIPKTGPGDCLYDGQTDYKNTKSTKKYTSEAAYVTKLEMV